LKVILSNCQYLESIRVWCDGEYLNEKDFLEILAKHSSKNFNELRIYYVFDGPSEIFPEELEEFFINWKNRIPRKSLSFIIKEYCVKSFGSVTKDYILPILDILFINASKQKRTEDYQVFNLCNFHYF